MKLDEYHIAIGNATDVGRVRQENEDYLAHFDTPFGYCMVICDGMGGHIAGQVAAQTALAAIQQYLQDTENGTPATSLILKNAIEFANFQLRQLIKEKPDLEGMGTTCVVALINKGQLYTAHAGDSRIYLIRDNNIRQITKDHSAVQLLIDEGIMTKAEAAISDKRNEIVKAIGIFERVFPTVPDDPITLEEGDRLLLCSDGLTDLVSETEIAEVMLSIQDVQSSSLRLVELANKNGGSDNITVQIVHYSGNSSGRKSMSKTDK